MTHRIRYHCSVTVTPASPPFSPASPSWSRPDDAVRQAQLDAMKRRATGLLALAAAVFAGASAFEGQYPWLGYVRATAEASLVGGLADWFAVTALFRHPLGLPIPHTAIVATRKERIGRILGTFVQNHFLSREVIAANLRAVRPAERAARWLSDPEHSRRIARQIAGGLAKTLEALPDEDVRVLVHEVVSARLRATRVAPALGKTLALVLADDRHQALLNEAVRLPAGRRPGAWAAGARPEAVRCRPADDRGRARGDGRPGDRPRGNGGGAVSPRDRGLDRPDGRRLGPGGDVPPLRAGRGARFAVRPDQRHPRRRSGGARDLHDLTSGRLTTTFRRAPRIR